MLLAYAAFHDLHKHHVDITVAFLHADIYRPFRIEQPHLREKTGVLVCKLQKAIYGLKTAPKLGQVKLRKALHDLGFHSLSYDTNVFLRNNTIISTYVDDFLIISASLIQIDKYIAALANAFELKDLGEMTKFLGANIERNSNGILINQQDKMANLCDDMKMTLCNGANTLISDDNLMEAFNSTPL